MGFLGRIRKFLSGGESQDPSLLDVTVRCARCGEVIQGQIHLQNDLSVKDDEDGPHYFCRKGLVGSGRKRCFNTVTVEYTFDANRNVIDRQIQGGQFVDEGV